MEPIDVCARILDDASPIEPHTQKDLHGLQRDLFLFFEGRNGEVEPVLRASLLFYDCRVTPTLHVACLCRLLNLDARSVCPKLEVTHIDTPSGKFPRSLS